MTTTVKVSPVDYDLKLTSNLFVLLNLGNFIENYFLAIYNFYNFEIYSFFLVKDMRKSKEITEIREQNMINKDQKKRTNLKILKIRNCQKIIFN